MRLSNYDLLVGEFTEANRKRAHSILSPRASCGEREKENGHGRGEKVGKKSPVASPPYKRARQRISFKGSEDGSRSSFFVPMSSSRVLPLSTRTNENSSARRERERTKKSGPNEERRRRRRSGRRAKSVLRFFGDKIIGGSCRSLLEAHLYVAMNN